MMSLVLAVPPARFTTASAAETPTSRVTTSLYGKAGLIEMPNALFFETGHLSMTGMLKEPDNRITLNFQPLPWFEGSFRYSIVEGYSKSRPTQPDLFDRSFDFKLKLLNQDMWWPAVAIGIQDIAGTGIYSSEFVVATWQTETLNLTGGFGFGRFATAGNLVNPMTYISKSAKNRIGFNGSILDTGQVRTGQFFRGEDMGLFGGIEYLTPLKGLKFLAEYSSDAYVMEENRGLADPDFPVNFGLSYRYGDNMEIGASLVHGNTFAMRFTIQTNPASQRDPIRLDPQRFQFRHRVHDPAPDVKPMAGDSDLYRQYSALHKKQSASTPQKQEHDYLAADNVWNPWEKTARLDRPDQGSAFDNKSDFKPVPANVDVDWIELTRAQGPSSAQSTYNTADYSVVQPVIQTATLRADTVSWRLATWSDERTGISERSLTPQSERANDFRGYQLAKPASLSNQDTADSASIEGEATLAYYAAPTQKDREALAKAQRNIWSWPLTEEDEAKIANSIRTAASAQKIAAVAVDFDDTRLTLYYYNGKYHREAEAIGRLLAVLTQAAPSRIETFTLIAVVNDLQVSEITVPRGTLERIVSNYGSPQELFNASTFQPGRTTRPRGIPLTKGKYPSLNYGLSPSIRYSLFDPDDPMRYQVSALVTGSAALYDGLSLSGIYRLNIYDNFDEIVRESNSILPHVRSDFPNYLNQSEHGLEMLTLNYAWQPAQDWYSRSFAGYFEEMYAGVGTEVMYRPYGKRWALALEVEYVQQREFDRGFKLRDYNTITGFAKWYYEVPYQDLKVEIHVGRYLAEDIGATFKVSRTFDNGTEIGAFATLTDVPFKKFGEGSFDKGIIIKIPFHSFSFFDTKRIYSTIIKPLTRDGGAQVWSGTPLYDTTHQYSLGNIRRNWGAVFE